MGRLSYFICLLSCTEGIPNLKRLQTSEGGNPNPTKKHHFKTWIYVLRHESFWAIGL